jgi:hypothetical protein
MSNKKHTPDLSYVVDLVKQIIFILLLNDRKNNIRWIK